eukprot:gene17277-23824_t
MISSAATAAPAPTWTLATLPSRSARMMFCIFMASTIAIASPDLISWPSTTSMETTRPGIGEMIRREVSAATFSGNLACNSASRGVATITTALAPRYWNS